MPAPNRLKVGDLVRFTALPDEWQRPGYNVCKDDIAFMKILIRCTWPSRIYEIDEYGTPWIAARMYRRRRWEYHTWGVLEATGWRLVKRRSKLHIVQRS